MNGGTFGLPGSTPVNRVVSFVRATAVLNGISNIAANAQAVQTTVTAPASDVNSLVLAASVSGRGALNWCGTNVGSGGGNLRTVLEVDGIIIYDQTATSVVAANGHLVIGGGSFDSSTSYAIAAFQPIQFQSGFRLLIGHSASGTTLRGFVNAEIYA